MNGRLGNADSDANVPCAVLVRGRKAVVVDYESTDGNTSGNPSQAHDTDDEDLCAPVHLEIPHHNGRDWNDDNVHEDGECARCEYECASVDACSTWYDFSISTNLIHGGSRPGI